MSVSVARCSTYRTVTVRICDVWTLLDLLLGVVVYPRFRVLYQPSATPDVIVRVFSFVERVRLLNGLLPLLLVVLQRSQVL
jgi:hypothetical protein